MILIYLKRNMTKIQIKKSHDTAKKEVLDFRHIINGAGSGEKTLKTKDAEVT